MTSDLIHLCAADPVLAGIIERVGAFEPTHRGDPFTALARAIVGQQISVHAAAAVWGRVAAACEPAGGLSPATIATLPDDGLRACGLSRTKTAYMKDLAAHFLDGTVVAEELPAMEDEAIIEHLTRVKGIGRWTAEMFLIFHLMRPDVLPVDDLGLRRAMERAYNDGEPLTRDEMRELGAAWSPWSSVATWYLWRSLDPVSF